jgi:excinuclease ABC subunit C
VEGPDDFASMQEIVTRRYSRLLAESKPLPDLVVVDGGKGQLSSAVEALKKLDLYGKLPIVGIAKNLEEIFYPEDPIPLHINKRSLSLKLIQRLRDEAHRFAITFHRLKRSKKSITSELDNIEGLGPGTREKLLKHFKSVAKVKLATEAEIISIIGKHKSTILKTYLTESGK